MIGPDDAVTSVHATSHGEWVFTAVPLGRRTLTTRPPRAAGRPAPLLVIISRLLGVEPTPSTVKRLMLLSRNECALDECHAQLCSPDWQRPLARICHIRGENRTSARFDEKMTDEDRRAFDNLLVLCPTCHARIDEAEPAQYPVDRLQEIKARHEGAQPTAPAAALNVDDRLVALVLHAYRMDHGQEPPAPALHAADPRDYDTMSVIRQNLDHQRNLPVPPTTNEDPEQRPERGVLDAARWLHRRLTDLMDLSGPDFHEAVRDPAFVDEVAERLMLLEPSAALLGSATDSAVLSIDNLGTVLEEPAGVRRLLQALDDLIEKMTIAPSR